MGFLLILFLSKPSYSSEDALLLALNIECSGKNNDWSKSWSDNFFAISTPYTLQGSRYWIARGADEGDKKYDGDIGQNIFIGTKTKKDFRITGEGTWLKNKGDVFKFKFISKGNKSIIEHLSEGVEGTGGKGKHKRECKIKLLSQVDAFDGIRVDKYLSVRDKKIEKLLSQIDNLKIEKEDKENNQDEINKINAGYNEKINSLENLIASLKAENEIRDKKIKELNDEVIETKNNTEFKTKYEDLKKELDKVNKELRNNEKQLTKYQNNLLDYQEKEKEEINRNEKEEEAKKIAAKIKEEKQIEEEKKKEERKINNLKYELGSSELVIAQNLINDLQDFIKNNPDEFDIVDIAELLIENKDIIDGNWGENSDLNFKKLSDFVNNSNNFLSYNLSKEEERFENAMKAMNEQYDLLLLKQTTLEELLNENLTSEFASDIIEKTKITRNVLSNYTFSRLTTTNQEIKEFLTNISIKIEQKNTEIKNKDIELSSFKSNYAKLQKLLSENLTTDNAPVILEKINELKVLNLDNFSSSEIKDLNKDISRFITTTFTKSLTNVSNIKTEENKVANSNETKSSEISSEQTNIVDLNPELIEFIKIVETAKLKYQEAKTDMAKGAVLSERNNQLVNIITRSIKKDEYDLDVQIGLIDNYQGELVKIGTNEEGRGKLGVVFGDDSFHLSTWDYAHEDALNYQDTLVPSSEPIYQSMLTLEEGDIVKVSGHLFMNEQLGHYDYQNPDLRSRVNDPYFVFKFTKIEKVN